VLCIEARVGGLSKRRSLGCALPMRHRSNPEDRITGSWRVDIADSFLFEAQAWNRRAWRSRRAAVGSGIDYASGPVSINVVARDRHVVVWLVSPEV